MARVRPRWSVGILLIALLTSACAGSGTEEQPEEQPQEQPGPSESDTPQLAPAEPSEGDTPRLALAERFIDAFYSWDPDALTGLPWSEDAYLGEITYYQGWAEGGNYKIINRHPCRETPKGAICRVTVEDDLLLALGLDFHATDTFRLSIEDGEIVAVETSSDDPELVGTATRWLREQKPEVAEGPCEGFFDGGPTPGDCVRAVVQGFEEFAASQDASN